MKELADTFVRFVRPHWGRLHVVARRYVATEHDARDLVQESLLRAWGNFSLTAEGAYKRAWLFVILRNVATEWHRRASRRITLIPVDHAELTEFAAAELSDPFAPLPGMDESRFREFLDQHVADAMDALEPHYREVLLLSVCGDLRYREIAEVLDVPIGTVMSRMARARRCMRDTLASKVPASKVPESKTGASKAGDSTASCSKTGGSKADPARRSAEDRT